MAPLIAAALPLLPKIPALAKTVAGIFGKRVPEGVTATAQIAGEVMDMVNKDQVTPEQRILLETAIMDHKEEILRIQNQRREIERQGQKDRMDTTVQLMDQGSDSQDPYVARTRPKILRQLFWACIIYAFVVTIGGGVLSYKGTLSTELVALVRWIGAWLFGTFTTAFVGYTAARTVDKKNPDLKNQANLVGKLIKKMV